MTYVFLKYQCGLLWNVHEGNEIMVTLCLPFSNYLLGVRVIKFCSNLKVRSAIAVGYKTAKGFLLISLLGHNDGFHVRQICWVEKGWNGEDNQHEININQTFLEIHNWYLQ